VRECCLYRLDWSTRARIVLLAAAGKQDKEIAGKSGITAHKVTRWRHRYLTTGLTGLEKDAPRAGRTPSISAAKVKQDTRNCKM
jgi:transposase